ncbi:MAG: hypothetical protein EOO04_26475, partial [Chitinophagaceae bacterium]
RIQSVDPALVLEEIARAIQPPLFRGAVGYDKWSCDFLIDFIINVHHSYMRTSMPLAVEYVSHLQLSHGKKFPELAALHQAVVKLSDETQAHIKQKESIIFPYIKQIAHAYEKKESYAGLLVRTLKKPVANLLHAEHRYLNQLLQQQEELTNHFVPPAGACLTHKVCFAKLAEVNYNLVQQLYLENQVLFPRAIAMEKKCLDAETPVVSS